MPARIVLLVTSPRLPAGLLSAQAWDLVRAHPVLAGAESPTTDALRSAGASVTVLPAAPPPQEGSPVQAMPVSGDPSWVEELLAAAAEHDTVVWLAGPAGDQELARMLGLRLLREPGLAELELVYGSWDPPGARLLDVVSITDHLRSPGGDPWKAEQTHQSLAWFIIEEAYEAYDAIQNGDLDELREEIGDVLLHVALHARLAEELPDDERWTIDDVAAGAVEKMIRRNPHVFAGREVADLDEIVDNWEEIKRAEKVRESALDGIPTALPALSLAAKIFTRAQRAGLDVPPPAAPSGVDAAADAEALGQALLGLVAAAHAAGVNVEAALRRAALAHAEALRAAERSR